MGRYILLQAENDRHEPDVVQRANSIARRRGPKHMESHTTLAQFIDAFYMITWLEEYDQGDVSDEDFLEVLFRKFNIEHPEGFESYSLSVGDIVDLDGRIYWCAPVGWERVN
jgi:hypothetical protein